MAKIAKNLTELIGNTPLLELANFNREKDLQAKIIAKLEQFNPLSSVKDRVGYAMLKIAEEQGLINNKSIIIEPTSGNTGIGLAFAAAAKGYSLIITMPENFSMERRNLLRALGAELILTPEAEGMKGAIAKAEALSREIPNSYMPQQFKNPANPEIHRKTTAEEIWQDMDGLVDIFVCGVGTGGTLTGVGEVLKQRNPNLQIVAVEPWDSQVLSGGDAGAHCLQGIGAGFIPDILNTKIIDQVIAVKEYQAETTMRAVAKAEGLLLGISGGAAVFAATKLAQKLENRGKNIIVLVPDTGERYLSTEIFSK